MGKKKSKKPDPQAELLLEQEMERLRLEVCLEQGRELCDENLNEAGAYLYHVYIYQREVPFTVDQAIGDLYELINVGFLKYDPGEEDANFECLGWNLNNEPVPETAPLDNWARGAIPTKKKKKKRKESIFTNPDNPNHTPSESGYSRTRSVTSRLRKAIPSAGSDKSKRKRGQLPDYIVQLDSEEGDKASKSTGKFAAFQGDAEESARLLKELEDKKKDKEAAKQKRLQEEQIEIERGQQLEKALRGKDFVLDQNGKVIVVQPVNTEKLPDIVYELEHQIETSHVEEFKGEEKEPRERRKERTKSISSQGSSTTHKTENKNYRAAARFQQSILKNPKLEVQAGVVIKEGNEGKTGPRWQDDATHMSRENFLLHQSMLQSQIDAGIDVSFTQEEIETSTVADLHGESGNMHEGENSPRDETEHQFDENEDLDYNMAMLNDPQWGRNRESKDFIPAVLPQSSHNQLALDCRRVQSPISPSGRKHLRSPPLSPLSPPAVGHESSEFCSFQQQNSRQQQQPNPGEYLRDFPSLEVGSIRVESDRAFRILGVSDNSH